MTRSFTRESIHKCPKLDAEQIQRMTTELQNIFRFLYLLSTVSMLTCIYSSDEAAELAASELEVSCVTGLPARTAKRSCRLFFVPHFPPRNPLIPSPPRRTFRSTMALRESSDEKPDQAPLVPGFGRLRFHCRKLRPMVESRGRCACIPSLSPS